MILDYKFNSAQRKFSVSYINEKGTKSIFDFNVSKFKTYYYTPLGKYMSETGAKCDVKWTEKAHKFDIKTYFQEMSKEYKESLQMKTFPKLYTFDIERSEEHTSEL